MVMHNYPTCSYQSGMLQQMTLTNQATANHSKTRHETYIQITVVGKKKKKETKANRQRKCTTTDQSRITPFQNLVVKTRDQGRGIFNAIYAQNMQAKPKSEIRT